jgi:gliding motility-associated protein GldL
MLSIGLLTEALFALSAFEPVDDELDWTVYPELANGVKGPAKAKAKVETTADAQGLLSQKLDAMLKMLKLMEN